MNIIIGLRSNELIYKTYIQGGCGVEGELFVSDSCEKKEKNFRVLA